ncbi:MAG: hypothetical protein KIT73_17175, partial [Burkholderiales bacterium]|nr:hypothetical protein [Burkholderiales bacterium]
AGYAALHEVRNTSEESSDPAPVAAPHEERRAFSPDEERYAVALWKVHEEVRMSAARMSFAGLSFMMGELSAPEMKDRVVPMVTNFRDALAAVRALKAPVDLQGLHNEYIAALELYARAAQEMTRLTEGGESHLIEAQSMSERAATLLLKVGDTLWPGEHKPN